VTALHTFGERVGRSKDCASLALCFAKMLPCLGFAVERSDLNQPSRRGVGLLNDLFDRYRFRFGGFGHSWHCFGGSDDRTRLGINDDDGALRPSSCAAVRTAEGAAAGDVA
jgi:hypothetical protein